MRRKRFSEQKIIGVLKEHEAGAKVDDICRRHGISSATFYTRRKKYSGMDASAALAELIAALIALVEHSMLHAFKLWHAGRSAEAENAWRLSGAAMLYGTAPVKRAALDGNMPVPAIIPGVKMQDDLGFVFQADMVLV